MIGRLSLALAACAILVMFVAACGGSASSNDGASGTVPANDSHTEPNAKGPVDRFAATLQDLGVNDYATNVPETFKLTASTYGKTSLFDSQAEGEKMLNGWGYVDGYETSYRPNNVPQSLTQSGAYYVTVEVHLFKDSSGAKDAYKYFASRTKAAGWKAVNAPQLGNDSSAYTLTQGTVAGSSNIKGVYELFMWRRGNVVGLTNTYGAQGFMNIQTARKVSVIEDNKILGKVSAPTPTPFSNFNPNPTVKSTSAPSSSSSSTPAPSAAASTPAASATPK